MPIRRPITTAVALVLLCTLCALAPAAAQEPGDLLISEYLEGSSNTKAVEIFNGAGQPVDLAAGAYVLQYYFNGSTTAGLTIGLTGTLAPGDVHVVAHASAAADVLAVADQTNGAGWFNGDDAVVLRRGDSVLDVVGQIGVDPGTEWGSGLTSTADNTLRRPADVCAGDPDGTDAFDPAQQWEGFATNTVDGLGAHTATCGGPVANQPPSVTTAPAALQLAPGESGSATITATDPDGTVVSLTLTDASLPTGITSTGDGVRSATLAVDGSAQPGEYVIGYTATDDDGATGSGAVTVAVAQPARISEVQGAGGTSPLLGRLVVVEAVVVWDVQDGAAGAQGDLNGVFLQEEDADADADPATSEGLFVFEGSDPVVDVAVGDLVRVIGRVAEFGSGGVTSTQISAVGSPVEVIGRAPLPTPATVTLPLDAADALEAVEGMAVVLPQTLYVAEHFNLDRFGELRLTDAAFGLVTPTQVTEPGSAEQQALADANARRVLTLDDGSSVQNPAVIPFVAPPEEDGTSQDNRRRGDAITGVTGVLDQSFGLYRVQVDPAQVTTEHFTTTIPRPVGGPDVGGDLTVASANVLNYFTTLGTVSACGPAALECRGATDQAELDRQTAKTVSALAALDADVLGLIEIENDADDATVAHLVAALDAVSDRAYRFVATGYVGGDAIKQALVYDALTVSPVGGPAVLDDPSFTNPLGAREDRNRPAVAQTFADADGDLITVVVNHLKSKGSSCAAEGDPDLGDGAGNCNRTRTAAVEALIAWLGSDPTGTGAEDQLVIGDLNSYAMEDPIDALTAAGFANLVLRDHPDAYGYVFDGQQGTLDYAFASPTLVDEVTGAVEHGINADEADLIDYNLDFGRDPRYFDGSIPYRASDHDPVVVGLALTSAEAGGPYQVGVGGTVPLDGRGSEDVLGRGLRYRWDLDGDGRVDAEGPTPTFDARGRAPGPRTISLTITDAEGRSSSDTAIVEVLANGQGNDGRPPGRYGRG